MLSLTSLTNPAGQTFYDPGIDCCQLQTLERERGFAQSVMIGAFWRHTLGQWEPGAANLVTY